MARIGPDGRSSDMQVANVRIGFSDLAYRCPIKFGGRSVDRGTNLTVAVRVITRAGREADGWGAMPLGNIWSFPSDRLDYDGTLGIMKDLARRLGKGLPGLAGAAMLDPLDFGVLLEERAFALAEEIARDRHLPVPVPRLCALVVASPFDAAMHDAFGKAAGRSVYHCYGPEFIRHDLAHYLDSDFAGQYLDRYVSLRPKARIPLYHLVGALDPLTASDVARPVGDGLPETLGEWIARDGLTHLKVKLNGGDLDGDVERVLAVNRVADESAPDRAWRFSLDFNERCSNVEYLLAFLRRIEETAPQAWERIQYIEQPTARDLRAAPENRMHTAAAIKPVVIDESLVDYESLLLAEELGYSGVALKACKGQTQSLLMAAAASRKGMFLCVQDLTCPGAAFLHSAGLAARVPGVAAVEGNARQYCPAANTAWAERFPGVFTVREGSIETDSITGPGLGCVAPGQSPADAQMEDA